MTAPDPETVREIAREHIRSGRTDIGTTMDEQFGTGVVDAMSRHEYGAWCSAVREAIRTAALSWPDEQQPAEATGGEQVQEGGPDDSFAMVAEDAPAGPARAVAEYWRDYATAVSNGGRFTDWAQIAQVAAWILAAMDAEVEQARAAATEPPCVCGDPNCMPYWRPVHQQMNEMRLRSDRAAADFTKAMLEEICEERTRAEQAEAERDALRQQLTGAQTRIDYLEGRSSR